MEGKDNFIEIQGIIRNTASSSSKDGQCDEIINLRFKDGSWRPINDAIYLKGLENIDLSSYDFLYVHANTYKHLLGCKNGYLYWIATMGDDEEIFDMLEVEVEICECDADAKITQLGNVIFVISNNSFFYEVFKKDKNIYSKTEKDYDGSQSARYLKPEGQLQFRVTPNDDGELEKLSIAESSTIWDGSAITGGTTYTYIKKNQFITAYEAARDACISLCKENGLLSEGFFYVMYALRTSSGEYTHFSEPILMCPNRFTRNPKKAYWKLDSYSFTNFSSTGKFITDSLDPVSSNSGENKRDFCVWCKSINTMDDAASGYGALYMALGGSKLQYRILSDFDTDFGNTIISLDIFITKEVSQFETKSSNVWGKILKYFYTIYENPDQIANITTNNEYLVISANDSSGVYVAFADNTPFYRESEDVLTELEESLHNFYRIKSIPIESLHSTDGDWVDIDLESKLSTLETSATLPIDSVNSRGSISPNVICLYNNKLHVADYYESWFHGFPLNYFFQPNSTMQKPSETISLTPTQDSSYVNWYTCITIKIDASNIVVCRYSPHTTENFNFTALNPLISYPDKRAISFNIVINCRVNDVDGRYEKTFTLAADTTQNFAYYIDKNFSPINICTEENWHNTPSVLPEDVASGDNYTNYIKVSSTDDIAYFPNENTYIVGNGKIVGMCANEVALSTGQSGDAPLYVFCTDGIYALFVDSSGQLTYSNSRPIARDVCNNAKSITPIDNGVLFSTDRGLMCIRGSQVEELSQSVEGETFDFTDANDTYYIKQVAQAVKHENIVNLNDALSKTDFLTYIKNAVIGYNYFEREIIVSNNAYDYSYIYNRGLWYKRGMTYDYFVNDYPKLYGMNSGQLYDLSHETESGNESVLLTRAFKFGTQEFKNGFRAVVRGLYHLNDKVIADYSKNNLLEDIIPTNILSKEESGRTTISAIETFVTGVNSFNKKTCSTNLAIKVDKNFYEKYKGFTVQLEYDCLYNNDDEGLNAYTYKTEKFNFTFNEVGDEDWQEDIKYSSGYYHTYIVPVKVVESSISEITSSAISYAARPDLYCSSIVIGKNEEYIKLYDNVYLKKERKDELISDVLAKISSGDYTTTTKEDLEKRIKRYAGIYVFGSYDNRKYSLLGANEKTGTFRDLGCKVSRLDCKFYRVLLVGDFAYDTSIEYLEFTAKNELLKEKIR